MRASWRGLWAVSSRRTRRRGRRPAGWHGSGSVCWFTRGPSPASPRQAAASTCGHMPIRPWPQEARVMCWLACAVGCSRRAAQQLKRRGWRWRSTGWRRNASRDSTAGARCWRATCSRRYRRCWQGSLSRDDVDFPVAVVVVLTAVRRIAPQVEGHPTLLDRIGDRPALALHFEQHRLRVWIHACNLDARAGVLAQPLGGTVPIEHLTTIGRRERHAVEQQVFDAFHAWRRHDALQVAPDLVELVLGEGSPRAR